MRGKKNLLFTHFSDLFLPFWAGLAFFCLVLGKIFSPEFLARHANILSLWRWLANTYGLSLPAVRMALFFLGVSFLVVTGYSVCSALGGRARIAAIRMEDMTIPLLLVLFIGAGFYIRMATSWQDIGALSSRVLIDDAFYSFQVAKNFSLGHGFSHDGISATNGVQPLVVIIMATVFKLASVADDLPVHVFLSIMSCLSILSMLLVYRIVTRLAGPLGALFSVFIWAFSPYIIKTELNGLETGLAAFFFLFSLHYYLEKVRYGDAGRKQFLTLGCLLGLGILARLDFSFFALALSLDYLFFSRQRLSDGLKKFALTAASACIISAPWFLYNFYLGGSLMPVSGKAVRFLAKVYGFHAFGSEYLHLANPSSFPDTLPWKYFALNFLHSLTAIFMPQPVLKVFPLDLWGKIISTALLIAVFLIAWKIGKEELKPLLLTGPMLYLVFLFLAYSLYVFGQWFYPRYYFPGIVIGVLGSGLGFSGVVVFMGKPLPLRRLPVAFATAVFCILLVSIFSSGLKRHFFPGVRQPPARYHSMAIWAEANTEEDAVIGAFQAGMIAYFTPRRVICLDGVVNTRALDALKRKEIDRYIRREGISYLMDWDWIIDDLYAGRSSSSNPYANLELVYDGFFQVFKIINEPATVEENFPSDRGE